jgi:NAD(P)-dependent dehydrogenase (short-subunit alcohol dehydrogenase family)
MRSDYDMGKLDGKIALITGGTTGIGAATANLFHAEGATVIVTGQNPRSVDAIKFELPGIEAFIADQGDPSASKGLMDQIKSKYGRLDVLFVNAGIAYFAPIEAVDEAFFDKQFNINVRGAYFVVKYGTAIMPDGGAVVLTGSTAGSSGGPAMSVYAATKAAVRSFSRTMAAELAPRNIRVNTLSPGPIETPIFGKTGLSSEQIDSFLADMKTRLPLGRIGRPEEVAAAALFLAADATFTTGGELLVGGGLVDV